MQHGKRTFLQGIAAGAAASSLATAGAQTDVYPNRPVSLIVPYPAGGSSDALARTISGPLSEKLGQTVVVENIGGAGGIIAAQRVNHAASDGHILYRGTLSELVLAPIGVPSVTFTSEDFRMVQIMTLVELALIVRKDLPVDSVDGFLEHAAAMAAQGKPLTYGSVGVGSMYHLMGEHLSRLTGIEFLHVPYRGGAPADQALLAGEIDFYIMVFQSQHEAFHQQGRLKILALLSDERRPRWADHPSITESARLKDLAFTMWGGVFVKRDTPEPIVQKLNQAIGDVLRDEDVRKRLEALFQQVRAPLSLDEASRVYQDGITQFRAMAKAAGLL